MFVQRFHTVHAPFIKHNKLVAAQSVGNRGQCERGMDDMPSGRNWQDIFCINSTDRRKAIISHQLFGRAGPRYCEIHIKQEWYPLFRPSWENILSQFCNSLIVYRHSLLKNLSSFLHGPWINIYPWMFPLTLLLLVTFSYKLMHHFKPFAIVVFEWWNNCVVLIPQMVWMAGQLIQNLVWILLSGESMDPLKPIEWIWMVVQLATNTVQMVSPCVYKTNGHFWKWKFWMASYGL